MKIRDEQAFRSCVERIKIRKMQLDRQLEMTKTAVALVTGEIDILYSIIDLDSPA